MIGLTQRSAQLRISAQQVAAASRHMSTTSTPRVAVLYQELEPPLINGVRKPKKPGGMELRNLRVGIQLRLTAVPRIQRFWSGHRIRAETPVRDRCHHPSFRSRP
jgi:hypothetical protein